MILRSNHRKALMQALNGLIPEAQLTASAVDDAAAGSLRINRTDLRCLGALLTDGSLSASKLAERVRLTRGSMTIALDRLEAAGYVRRIDDPDDRRGVRVEATAAAMKAIQEVWEPIRVDGNKLLERYSDEELKLLGRFFGEYCDLQRKHAERIRRMKVPKRR
jgi:DNA-binding MarR family transcriptional regulator